MLPIEKLYTLKYLISYKSSKIRHYIIDIQFYNYSNMQVCKYPLSPTMQCVWLLWHWVSCTRSMGTAVVAAVWVELAAELINFQLAVFLLLPFQLAILHGSHVLVVVADAMSQRFTTEWCAQTAGQTAFKPILVCTYIVLWLLELNGSIYDQQLHKTDVQTKTDRSHAESFRERSGLHCTV